MLFNLISFFTGFICASIIDTSLGEFGEWAIVGSALVVANIETFNNFYYAILTKRAGKLLLRRQYNRKLFSYLNFFKIGLLYGLIVDAFKLGS